MEEKNNKWMKQYEGVRESHSNIVSQLQHINHKIKELVKEVKLLEDQANKKEKEWLDKKIIYESGHQEMVSIIEVLQNRVSTYEI